MTQTSAQSGAVARSSRDDGVRIIACLRQTPSSIAAVVATLSDGGRSMVLGEARAFSRAQLPALRSFLKSASVEVVIRTAPAAETLVRTTTLPESVADRQALADALALLAESEMPAQLPWYRRAGGLIRSSTLNGVSDGGGGGGSGGAPWALLAGWRPSGHAASMADAMAETLEGFGQLWTIEPVGLAKLLRNAVEGPGEGWIASLERESGIIQVAAVRDGRLLMRVLRAPAADADRFTQAAAAAVGETIGRDVRIAPDAMLTVSPGLTPRVAGAARDAAWLAKFGVAAALAETFAEADPAVRSLFSLQASEPRRRLGFLQGLMTWLSPPVRAAAAVAACIALLLLVPLGVAYARHHHLKKHITDSAALNTRLAATEGQVAFYSLLREKRWPMTKLMADIATSTPEGITLDTLDIAQDKPISLSGTARSNDLISKFRSNLIATRVFASVNAPDARSTADGVQFKIEATVSPTGSVYRGNPIDDFAKNPLGKRIYGDEWIPSEPGDEPAEPAESTARSTDSRSSGSVDRPRSSSASSSRSSSGSPPAVPPPLSSEDIAKLDRTAAMMEFAKRQGLSKNQQFDEATRERLREESQKARKRMQDLDQKGGGS